MVANPSSSLLRLSDSELKLKNRAEDIRGFTVIDRSGEDIGGVDDLLIDEQEHKVRFLQLASGGFLGLGSKEFLNQSKNSFCAHKLPLQQDPKTNHDSCQSSVS